MGQRISSEAYEVRARVLGLLLRNARESAGKTVDEVAAAVGCPPPLWRAYELGDKPLTLPELELAAYYLQIPMSHFADERTLAGQPRREISDPEAFVEVRQRIIGSLLLGARSKQCKSLRELSEAVGIPRRTLQRYEMGERAPLPALEAIAAELGLEMTALHDGAPAPAPAPEPVTAPAPETGDGEVQQFQALPPEVRHFVVSPTNAAYLQVAMRLSSLTTEKLRAIAEGLLDITF